MAVVWDMHMQHLVEARKHRPLNPPQWHVCQHVDKINCLGLGGRDHLLLCRERLPERGLEARAAVGCAHARRLKALHDDDVSNGCSDSKEERRH